jgi:5'-3' exoribonuclease 2
VITPGTEFMGKLALYLRYYIHDRFANNPAWKGVTVLLSDASVPGEGEHKLMEYIRQSRSQPDYNPSTHHILCGLDAGSIE